eukprot:TRINITY_DN1099_c0_g2_i1.p1 TRINITY_DN1099_c0_g2~~TRINITY_DN1099_c0_g2_i1.p1  ORF type:complete len:421 (-),score=121.76 TRINITY_DN1099_c0_g2_i1:241-1458(-)
MASSFSALKCKQCGAQVLFNQIETHGCPGRDEMKSVLDALKLNPTPSSGTLPAHMAMGQPVMQRGIQQNYQQLPQLQQMQQIQPQQIQPQQLQPQAIQPSHVKLPFSQPMQYAPAPALGQMPVQQQQQQQQQQYLGAQPQYYMQQQQPQAQGHFQMGLPGQAPPQPPLAAAPPPLEQPGGKAKKQKLAKEVSPEEQEKHDRREKRKEKKEKKARRRVGPKKPSTAFFLFLQEYRAAYQRDHPEVKAIKDIAKLAGEMWKTMEPDRKQPYIDRFRVLKEKYDREKLEMHGAPPPTRPAHDPAALAATGMPMMALSGLAAAAAGPHTLPQMQYHQMGMPTQQMQLQQLQMQQLQQQQQLKGPAASQPPTMAHLMNPTAVPGAVGGEGEEEEDDSDYDEEDGAEGLEP